MNTQSLARLPRSFQEIFEGFDWIGRRETVDNLCELILGWILNPARQTVSRALVALRGGSDGKHHSALYRFLAGASWSADDLGEALFGQLLRYLPKELVVLVDDTLCKKTGPFLFGGGMHRDEKNSSGGAKRTVKFSFGHNFVILAVWLPVPWNPEKGVGIPLLARLYRSQKTCPKTEYSKRTELAVAMLHRFAEWVDFYAPGRRVVVVGDVEYACRTVVQQLPESFQFTGPMRLDARLWTPLEQMPVQRVGRPRRKGYRLPKPEEMATDSSIPWRPAIVRIYGRRVRLQVKCRLVLWYRVAASRQVLLVVTRDPRGRYEDRAYFTTQTSVSPLQVLRTIARRWTLEVTFRDTKQHLGLEDPQNGYRRRKTRRRSPPKAGPQPRGKRGLLAVTRTVPTLLCTYGITWLWYLANGDPDLDVRLARRLRPWDRGKTEPSYEDVLTAVRRALARAGLSNDPLRMRVLGKCREGPARAERAA